MLESVAELATPPQTFPIPTKGTYITFKTGGGTHEAHVQAYQFPTVQSCSNAGLFLRFAPALVGGGADDDAARSGCATIQWSVFTHSTDVGNPASRCFKNAPVEQVPPFDTTCKRQTTMEPHTQHREKKKYGQQPPARYASP